MSTVSAPVSSRPASGGPTDVFGPVGAAAICVVAVATGAGIVPAHAVLAGMAAVLAGTLLAWLALNRFELFVMVIFAARPAVDSLKFGPRSASVFDATALLSLGLIAGGLAWWHAARDEGRQPALTGVHCGLLFFLACAAVITAGSLRPAASAAELIRISSIVAMFMIVDRLLRRDADVFFVLKAAFLGSLAPLLIGVAGWAASIDLVLEEKAGITRLTSTFTQSNSYSRYLMVLVLVALALRRSCTGAQKHAADLVIAAGGLSLLLTGTRASQIALVMGVLVIGWLDNSRLIAGAMLVCGALAMLAPWTLEPITSSFDESSRPAVVDEPGDSLSWRLFYWERILPMAADHPATGIGFGSTPHIAEGNKEPHSDVVRVIVEGGAVGVAAYLALIASLGRLGRRALVATSGRRDHHRGIAVGFVATSISLFLAGLVSNVMTEVPVMWTYMVLAACATYVVRAARARAPHVEVAA